MPVSFKGCKNSAGSGNLVGSHRGNTCIDISEFYAIDPGSEIHKMFLSNFCYKRWI